jgi:hypothetical protein
MSTKLVAFPKPGIPSNAPTQLPSHPSNRGHRILQNSEWLIQPEGLHAVVTAVNQ